MEREKALAKNTFILAIGTTLPKAVAFITLPILTMYLTKAEYGTYDLFNTLVSLFLPMVTLQIQSAAFRYLIEYRQDKAEQQSIVTNIYIFTGVISVVSLTIFYLVMGRIAVSTRLLVCVYFFLDVMINTSRQVIRGLGKNRVYSVSSILNSVTNLLFIYMFVKVCRYGLDGVLASLCVALLVSQMYILFKINIFSYIRLSLISGKVIKKLIGYSWPMVPNSLSGWVMRLSDRLVITYFLGVEANAVYAVANKLPVLYGTVQSTFTLAWQENASIVSKDSDTEQYYSEMFDTMYCMFAGIMSLLIAGTPILFMLLIRGDYDMAYEQMPILYMGSFFSSLSSYLGGIYVAHMETKKVGITTAMAAACNLLIDFFLVNRIGIFAGSISTLVSYVLLVGYRMYDVQKIQKMYFKFHKMAVILLALVLMGFMNYLNSLLWDVVNLAFASVLTVGLNRKMLTAMWGIFWKKWKKKK